MKEDTISFGISKIETDQFAILEENYAPKLDVQLDTALEFKIDTITKQIAVSLSFSFLQKKKAFLKIENTCIFQISDDSWKTLLKDESIVLPKGFATHITIISIGTARGVLHTKTSNTSFNKFILPTIDALTLVPEDLVFLLPDSKL